MQIKAIITEQRLGSKLLNESQPCSTYYFYSQKRVWYSKFGKVLLFIVIDCCVSQHLANMTPLTPSPYKVWIATTINEGSISNLPLNSWVACHHCEEACVPSNSFPKITAPGKLQQSVNYSYPQLVFEQQLSATWESSNQSSHSSNYVSFLASLQDGPMNTR